MDENHDLYADLKEIQTAAKRSADITKQLLAFARKQTISPRQLDLNDTVESMLNMLRRLIGEDIDLSWLPARQLGPVKMDPSQIDQILANLCINARDAIDGVGKLTIETGRKSFDEEYCCEHQGFIPGDFVLLAVSDNGCGMDKDTLDNLFEPFFTTKEFGKGTGLGLATVSGIPPMSLLIMVSWMKEWHLFKSLFKCRIWQKSCGKCWIWFRIKIRPDRIMDKTDPFIEISVFFYYKLKFHTLF